MEDTTKEELLSTVHFKRSFFDDFSGWLTGFFGSSWFLLLNVIVFISWIGINLGLTPLPVFDPFPFLFLSMTVSLEAIVLAIIVLMSQNRDQRIDDIRSKLDFEIDYRGEREITKILFMLEEVQDHLGIKHEDDEDLRWMKKRTDLEALKQEAERDR